MAQFDVHRAPPRMQGRAQFLVLVQSARLDRLKTRVVIPLVASPGRVELYDTLSPEIEVAGQKCVLVPWEIFTIPTAALGERVANLAEGALGDTIIRSIDELVTRAYG